LFLIGKIIRFLLFFVFLSTVLGSAKTLVGYNPKQVILFFLVFNLVDISTQYLFRGVYHFRSLVISGDYDLVLLKPLPSFFSPIFSQPDILDFITLIPLWIYFLWFVISQGFFSLGNFVLFLTLFVFSLILAFAIHLFIASVCLLTTSIDPLVWIYRDSVNMARFPTDIYTREIQAILTFPIPVVILITVPTKALMGVLCWQWVLGSLFVSGLFLWSSLELWHYALSKYSSASS